MQVGHGPPATRGEIDPLRPRTASATSASTAPAVTRSRFRQGGPAGIFAGSGQIHLDPDQVGGWDLLELSTPLWGEPEEPISQGRGEPECDQAGLPSLDRGREIAGIETAQARSLLRGGALAQDVMSDEFLH